MNVTSDLYNEISYSGRPSPERTLDRLWWVARLRGVSPVDPSQARVLELGCSTGRLLASLAERHRKSHFLGIDISANQIEDAKSYAQQCEVSNIEFLAQDFLDYDFNTESYDYIFCHGVYSWIGPKEARALLTLIQKVLSPNGIAYVSHNSLPGWQSRYSVCQLLSLFDDRTLPSPERVAQARLVLEDGAERLVDSFRPFGLQLKEELERNVKRSDSFILHELLNPHVNAVSIKEMIASASEHSLAYVGDAHPQRMQLFDLRHEPLTKISEVSFEDHLQYLDYLFPTSFRGSLFVSQNIELSTNLISSALEACWISSPLVPDTSHATQENLFDYSMLPFYGPSDEVIEPKAPPLKILLSLFAERWPKALSYSEAMGLVKEQIPFAIGEEEKLQENLLGLFFRNLLDVYVHEPAVESRILEKPLIALSARASIADGWITSLRGEYFKLDPLDSILLPLLDGKHDKEQLKTAMKDALIAGKLQMKIEGEAQEEWDPASIDQAISDKFSLYREQALFFAPELDSSPSSPASKERTLRANNWLESIKKLFRP